MVSDSLAEKSFLAFHQLVRLFQLATTSNVILHLFFYTLLGVASFPKHFTEPELAVSFSILSVLGRSVHVTISGLFRVGCPDQSFRDDEVVTHPMFFWRHNTSQL